MPPRSTSPVRPPSRGDPLESAADPHGFRKLSASSFTLTFTHGRPGMPAMTPTNMICMQGNLFHRCTAGLMLSESGRATSSPAAPTLGTVAARPNPTAAAVARLLSTRPRSPTTPSNVHLRVRASAYLHQSWEGVLEPLLTLRVCRGDPPDGGSRFHAPNPPPTAPIDRLTLAGCSIDGKRRRTAASSR